MSAARPLTRVEPPLARPRLAAPLPEEPRR